MSRDMRDWPGVVARRANQPQRALFASLPIAAGIRFRVGQLASARAAAESALCVS